MTITEKQAKDALALTGHHTAINERYLTHLTPQEQHIASVALKEAGLIEELPEVEPFVAEWFEAHKDKLESNIWRYIRYRSINDIDDFYNFMKFSSNEPIETLFKMKQGYTVKKQPLFMARFKNILNSSGTCYVHLVKHYESGRFNTWISEDEWVKKAPDSHLRAQLTEKELIDFNPDWKAFLEVKQVD